MDTVYWVVGSKDFTYIRGESNVLGPKLYTTEKQARRCVRGKYKTDAYVDQHFTFTQVKLSVA